MAFEIVERLAAALAAPQRLAGGRTELGQHFGIPGAALRACHLLHAEQRAAGASSLRRRDAVFPTRATETTRSLNELVGFMLSFLR